MAAVPLPPPDALQNAQQASIRLGVVKASESHLLELLIWQM